MSATKAFDELSSIDASNVVRCARALLRRPRLLLLDEATSQLDAVNEMALRDVVADAARTTTVLVVAHRLSTVTLADRIIVMDAGEVRAVGHTEARLKEAAKLGFEQIIMPMAGGRGARRPGPEVGLRVQEIRRLGELPGLLGCDDRAPAPTRALQSVAFHQS